MFDIAQIRKQFPILNSNQTDKPLVYLDNAATTHKPKVVIDRLTQFYSKENSNIHRGIYELAFNATRHYELARQTVSNFINARSPDEIVFCRGTTEALNMITQGLRSQLRPEDEILVTAMEHHANYVPWQTVCKQSGARFRVAPVKPDGSLDLDQLQNMISSKTKVFAVTHISNTLGTINPLSKIVEIARKKGALVVVDGAQSIAFDSIDIQEIGCDFFAFSGHKAFGPMGVGVLYGKMEQLSTLEPYQQGGAMIVSVTEDQTTFKPPPQGLEAGTPPVAGAIALATALDFISGLGLKQIKEHSQSTLQYAKHRLSSIQGLKQIGPASGTSNILSFLLDNVHPHDIATILSEAGVAVRAGHHCTQPLMQALGINSTVRVSFSIYNDKDEVDQLVDALRTVKKIMS
jgi:cysteine desulfurase/selenocysteine lyase